MIIASIRNGNSGESHEHRGKTVESIVARQFGRRKGIEIRRSADPNSPHWGQVVEVVRQKWTPNWTVSYKPITYILGTINWVTYE